MKLSQVAGVSSGYPFRGAIPEYESSEVVAVQMKDASWGDGVKWSRCIRTHLSGKRAPDWLRPGDILVASRGSHNYAVLVDDGAMRAGLKAVAAPHFYVVCITTTGVLPEYLVWLLNQKPCQRYLEQNAEGTLTKSIRRSVLEGTPIAVPALAQQKNIVELVKKLRDEQRMVKQLLANGEQLMNAIARDLLGSEEISR